MISASRTGRIQAAAGEMRRTTGFTLIEILMVVTLIGILAAMSGPAVVAGMERYKILSAGQQVVSTIRGARLQAVARNSQVRLRFNFPAAGQYQALVWNSGTSSWDSLSAVNSLANGISFGSSTDLKFTTLGRLDAIANPAAATIVVTNGNADDDRTVGVSTSGQVTLE